MKGLSNLWEVTVLSKALTTSTDTVSLDKLLSDVAELATRITGADGTHLLVDRYALVNCLGLPYEIFSISSWVPTCWMPHEEKFSAHNCCSLLLRA